MNILIVDDEAISVEGIAHSMNWESLGIVQVFKAYSMEQSQKILTENKIDILLCDIEMPKGSGIDLMEWIRAQNMEPVCIFLTSFSRFDYASSAVRLQMFDYILKPCEYSKLEAVLKKAVDRVQETKERERKEQLSRLWDSNVPNRTYHFWDDLIQGNLSTAPDAIAREIHRQHLDPSLISDTYIPVYIRTMPKEEMERWEGNSWRYGAGNISTELLQARITLSCGDDFISLIPHDSLCAETDLKQSCTSLINTLTSLIPADFLCLYASSTDIEQLPALIENMKKEAHDKYALNSIVLHYNQVRTPVKLPCFSTEKWQNALLALNNQIILEDIREYLTSQNPQPYKDRAALNIIYHQLLGIIYNITGIYHLDTNMAPMKPDGPIPEEIFQSTRHFLRWAEEITAQTVDMLEEKENFTSVINTLVQYIHEHLQEDLNRSELTEVVHLHPDYLSALFSQKMGISLSKYITMERIKEAKRLLLSTDLPINEIAIRTGFPTIPYFSKQFKKLTKLTPNQYRKSKGSS